MSLFQRLTLTVATYTNTLNTSTGEYTKLPTLRKIRASVQPADPETLEMLPEFDKAQKYILIVTGDLVAEKEVVVYNSENYRIIKVDDFRDMGLLSKGYIQAIGVRNV